MAIIMTPISKNQKSILIRTFTQNQLTVILNQAQQLKITQRNVMSTFHNKNLRKK